jgi:hypothetical protein
MMNEFTIEELISAIQGARPDDANGGVRLIQLVEASGMSEVVIARRLRRLIADGRVECVRIAHRRIDGVVTRVPSYRLIDGGDVMLDE